MGKDGTGMDRVSEPGENGNEFQNFKIN